MAQEYWRKGVTKVHFTTVALVAAPTAAQIAAATDLSPQILSLDGFETAVERIDIMNLDSVFTSTINGARTVSGAAITFNDKKNPAGTTPISHDPIRALLALNVTGSLVISPYGTTTGNRCQVWPVQSSGPNDIITLGNETAQYKVDFGITGLPADYNLAA